jgi:hypothetical protein
MSPAKSKSQARLFAAAEHGADFPAAKKLRESLPKEKLREFATGSRKDLPEHVEAKHSPLKAYLMRRMTGGT